MNETVSKENLINQAKELGKDEQKILLKELELLQGGKRKCKL